MSITQFIITIVLIILINFSWDKYNAPSNSNALKADLANPKEANNKLSTVEKSFFSILFLIPLCIGLWMTNIWFVNYNKSVDALSWQQVTGKIIEKRVGPAPLLDSQYQQNVRGSNFQPFIEYEYMLNTNSYISNKISYLNMTEFYDASKAQIFIDQFPSIGKTVTVYVKEYNDNFNLIKTDSVLLAGTKGMTYWTVLLSSLFVLIGLIGLKKILL